MRSLARGKRFIVLSFCVGCGREALLHTGRRPDGGHDGCVKVKKKYEVFVMVALNLCKYLFRLKDMIEATMLLSREDEVRGVCGDDVVGYCEVHQEDRGQTRI